MDKKNQSKAKPEIVKEIKVESIKPVEPIVIELTDEEILAKYAGCETLTIRLSPTQEIQFRTYNGISYPLYSDAAVYLFSRNPSEWIRFSDLCRKKFGGK